MGKLWSERGVSSRAGPGRHRPQLLASLWTTFQKRGVIGWAKREPPPGRAQPAKVKVNEQLGTEAVRKAAWGPGGIVAGQRQLCSLLITVALGDGLLV